MLFSSEQLFSAAKDLPEVQELEARARIDERVDGLVAVLCAKRGIELNEAEIADLRSRSLGELPSFVCTGKVTSREEFLELAKLNGHAPPDANETASDD